MRAAVFHDFFSTIGGGERVAVALASCLDADIITTDVDTPEWFLSTNRVRSLGRTSTYPGLRQIRTMSRFLLSDVRDEYDLFVFSGNWAHHASLRHTPSFLYCHTPVRAFYDLYPVFMERQHPLIGPFFATACGCMRWIDKKSIHRVSNIVANSFAVKDRIRQYYGRDADVIYPAVDCSRYSCKEYGDFWLSVNRIYPEKRIELQIEAFSHLPNEQLIIVGGYAIGDHARPYAKRIREMAAACPNVHLVGQISDDELTDLYSRCTGVLCTAMEEDFGLSPLESMASGKPVIAVAEGGFLETITTEQGVLINPNLDQLIAAIQGVSQKPEQYYDACLDRAKAFDIRFFNDKIKQKAADVLEMGSSSAL
ncbi:MAG TPA: glycosyltransferase [Methanospirillum sp.]|nr:glycosyltransferase [Methanospirillum sp.]